MRNRIIHLVRHAESEFNVLANHQIEGFVKCVTKLDANLTPTGLNQARSLRDIIEQQCDNDPYAIKNAQAVISSPLVRSIDTALNAMPFHKYKYIIRPEITEQIENTTDIPSKKHALMEEFPFLKEQISTLPNGWWWRHPHTAPQQTSDVGSGYCPEYDAKVLHELNGEEPASESKHNVRQRVQWFFYWLWHHPEISKMDNIAVFSHSCTIFEMERYLRGLSDDCQYHDQLKMFKNAEVRSFPLFNKNQIPQINNSQKRSQKNLIINNHTNIDNKCSDDFYIVNHQQPEIQMSI